MTNMNQEVLSAYTNHQHSNDDDREIDKRALLASASRLKEALDTQGNNIDLYREAIKYNQKLWTLFQVALCEPDNQLPDPLKMNLLSLSRYVDRTSFRAITQYTPQHIVSLIDINRIIAAGLAQRPQAAAQQQPVTIEQQTVPQSVMISA